MSFNSGKNRVEFKSSGTTVVGDLYCPDDFDRSQVHPAIVVGGPLSTVKEQAAGVFARALANRGYIALAFDYRTFGESGGEPRYYENPAPPSVDREADQAGGEEESSGGFGNELDIVETLDIGGRKCRCIEIKLDPECRNVS